MFRNEIGSLRSGDKAAIHKMHRNIPVGFCDTNMWTKLNYTNRDVKFSIAENIVSADYITENKTGQLRGNMKIVSVNSCYNY